MKKIVLLLAVLLFGAGSMMTQQDKPAAPAATPVVFVFKFFVLRSRLRKKQRKQRRQRRKLRRKPRLTHSLNKRCKL